ncbi:MAG: hypothetical protein AB1631_26285 [Acidobacteriota bacterium]
MSDTTQESDVKASDIHALANVFVSILSQLNDAAAKQSMSVLEMAALAAKVAQSLASSATDVNPHAAEEVIAPLVEQFNKASQQYREISLKAQADLQAYIASLNEGAAPPNGKADLADQVFANLIAGINLMIQNAVANQQAVNELGSATLAQGVILVYKLAANRRDIPVVESAKPS